MEKNRNIIIPSENGRSVVLDAFFKSDGQNLPLIIFLHGFKGFKDWGPFDIVAEHFAKANFAFIKMNFSHNGTSPETPDQFTNLEGFAENNFSRELRDIDHVLHWVFSNEILPDQVVDKHNITLIGHSRGGSTAIMKTGEDERIKKLITWSAPNNIESRWEPETLKQWEEDGVIYIENARTGQKLPMNYQIVQDFYNNQKQFDIKTIVENLERPMMVAHGTEDEAVPIEHAMELKKWNPHIKLELLPGTGHTFGAYHPYDSKKLPIDFENLLKSCINFLKGSKK